MRHARADALARTARGDAPGAVDDEPGDAAVAHVDEVMAWLQAHHYLSEERFV